MDEEEDYIHNRYESKHEDLRLAERIEKELDKIVDELCWDVWFTVDMHTLDNGGEIKTERLIGDPERIEKCKFCGKLTRCNHKDLGWVCASCLGDYERGKRP